MKIKKTIRKAVIYAMTPFVNEAFKIVYKSTVKLKNAPAHIFVHSLSVDPELSFRADHDSTHDFESWFVTVSEFKEMLERLYSRGYCLVDIHDAVSGELQLPEGKKPLVLSLDDVNYYSYMTGYGFASRMILTEDGKIANTYVQRDGSEIVTYEGDSVPIVESFIEKHPDFSYNGARGVIALTGYEGILGYRNPEEQREEIMPLVAELKRKGWLFASHSFHHSHSIYTHSPMFIRQGKEDIRKWMESVGSFVGDTDIFITPFGIDTRHNPHFDAYLRRCGFRIFCSIFKINQIGFRRGAYYYTRINLDGVKFMNHPETLKPFFGNVMTLLSPYRKRKYQNSSTI